MDRIQTRVISQLNEFIHEFKMNYDSSEGKMEYSKIHSTELWGLLTLRDELICNVNDAPLVTIERFSDRMKKYSYRNNIFSYVADITDVFIRTII